jgi:hypothetical protein
VLEFDHLFVLAHDGAIDSITRGVMAWNMDRRVPTKQRFHCLIYFFGGGVCFNFLSLFN